MLELECDVSLLLPLLFSVVFLGFFYMAWFRYDLIEKWADEDHWTAPEFYHSHSGKWFMRLFGLLTLSIGLFLLVIFMLSLFEAVSALLP